MSQSGLTRRLQQSTVSIGTVLLGTALFCFTLLGTAGCSSETTQQATDILGNSDSKFANFDRDTWVAEARSLESIDFSQGRIDLSLLSQRHFLGVAIDGARLRDYFDERSLDIDRSLLGTAAPGLSLKALKSILLACDDQMASGLMNPQAISEGWFVQLDFESPVDQQVWNGWLMGPEWAESTTSQVGTTFTVKRPATSKEDNNNRATLAVQWRSETRAILATESELRRLEQDVMGGGSDVAADLALQSNPAVLSVVMRATALHPMVEQFSQMATAFGGVNSEAQAMFDTVRATEKLRLQLDLRQETMLDFQADFLDKNAAKTALTFVKQGIDQLLSQPLPDDLEVPNATTPGTVPRELLGLLQAIQGDLARGGLQSDLEDQTVRVRARRPARMDDAIDQALAGIVVAQAEVAKRLKLQRLARAIQSFYEKHGRYPAPSNPPLAYGATETATDEENSASAPPFSWRVALLPHLDQQALYDEFDFSQTWDSPHNRNVAARMPSVFSWDASATEGESGLVQGSAESIPQSDFQYLTGSMGAMGNPSLTQSDQIPDGSDRTLMWGHTPHVTTAWSAPGGWDVESNQDLVKWLQSQEGPVHAAMFSGRVVMLPGDMDIDTLLGWITPAGKERFNRKRLNDATLFQPLTE